MGIGDWGLGIGDWGLGPGHEPQWTGRSDGSRMAKQTNIQTNNIIENKILIN